MATAVDILREAAVEVAKGWCRFRSEDDKGNCCAYGAICRVSRRGDVAIAEAERAFWEFCNYLGDDRAGIVSQWNDTAGRTKDQVVHALRECAVIIEMRQA